MPSFEGDALFAKSMFEFMAAIIVVVGVPIGFYQANSRRSTRHLSELAMSDYDMGYFVSSRRCWLWFLSLFYIPTVKVPRVPSLGTLITAGDDGIWGSAMLFTGGSGPHGKSSKDSIISWVPVYEAFFREYAWALDRRELEDLASLDFVADHWRWIMEGKRMKKYKEEAAFDVWLLKHRVSNAAWNRHTRSRWFWPLSIWRSWCIRHIMYKLDRWYHSLVRGVHAFFYAYQSIRGPLTRLVHDLTAVDVEFDLILQADRHLFYYPWNIYAKESDLERCTWSVITKAPTTHNCEVGMKLPIGRPPRRIRPLLVSCFRPVDMLDPVNTSETIDDNRRTRLNEAMKGERLRIFNGIPALRVSEEDLGALCMMLGIETQGQHFQPGGRGALGHLLSSHRDNGMNIFRLVYHKCGHSADDITAGSGYSSIFAKDLACGCIPFAKSTDKMGKVHVHTINITAPVCKEIMRGGAISDANARPGQKSIWNLGRIKFLQALPGIGRHNYFNQPCYPPAANYQNGSTHQVQSSYGLSEVAVTGQTLVIRERYGIEEHTEADSERDNRMGGLYRMDSWSKQAFDSGLRWWNVVAGIAFGGIVPMTTRRLADLVSFTVGGLSSGEDMIAFRRLTKVVLEEVSARTGQPECEIGALLFGKNITRTTLESLNNRESPPVDFTSEALDTGRKSIRSIGRKLEWLTTLLEALVSMVPDTRGKRATDLALGSFESGAWKRDEVFKACADQIRDSYVAAVVAHVNGELQHRGPGIADLLQEPIDALKTKKCEISAKHCGTVAKCIIMAWASLVRIVEWDDDENGESNEPWEVDNEVALEANRRKAHKLLTLDELPDIALWE